MKQRTITRRAEKGLRVTWERVVLSALGCKKVYVEGGGGDPYENKEIRVYIKSRDPAAV